MPKAFVANSFMAGNKNIRFPFFEFVFAFDVFSNNKGAIDEGADVVDKAIATAASGASHATRRAKEVAETAVDNGRDALEGALTCAKDMVHANPIATVAVVAAIAYLWGRIQK